MKTSIFYSLFAIVSLCSLSTLGQGSCPNDGGVSNNGQPPYINDPTSPYTLPDNNVFDPSRTATGVAIPNPFATGGNPKLTPQAAAIVPAVPAARITVVSADTSPNTRTSKTPTATLTVVTDDVSPAPSPKEIVTEQSTAIDSRFAGLVGIWKAVARRANGELTTVELHLDNRGWAELTVPGSDGKSNTTKSRANLENDELKLKGDADKVVSLGKLVEVTSRQMVLERAEGRVTFVRL